MRSKGTLVEWNDDRGFGFIEPAEGGPRVFCHVKAFAVRVRRPAAGDRITYEVAKDDRGRTAAVRVRPLGLENASYKPKAAPRREASSTPSANWSACVGVIAFFMFLLFLVGTHRVPWFVPPAYLGLSVVTLFAYAWDKNAAMTRRWRTREQTLHMLELFGGWPGAWIAQKTLRHKSSKLSFQIEFWLCVVVNIAVLTWYAAGRS
ncbi:MAG: DUF1294 domain-containing protein [Steroidobacteraceae bacterium]